MTRASNRAARWLPLALLLAHPALADEVLLRSGERLVGKVLGLAEGKLAVESEALGKVSVPLDKVLTLSTEEPVEVHLEDGSVLRRRLLASEEGQVGIEEVGAEPRVLALPALGKINPPPPPPPKWTGQITASLAITRGNSDTQTGSVTLGTSRRGADDRIRFDAGYTGGRQTDRGSGEEITTARALFAAMQYDYFFSKKFYGYVNSRGEKDGVAELDLRLIAGAGGGCQWRESERFNLSTEAGLSWFSENFSDETKDQDHIAARLAGRVDGTPAQGVKLFHDVEWFPSLESGKDHFVKAQAGVRSTLTKSLFAEAKIVWDWDSTPAENAVRTNVKYLLGLGWSF